MLHYTEFRLPLSVSNLCKVAGSIRVWGVPWLGISVIGKGLVGSELCSVSAPVMLDLP